MFIWQFEESEGERHQKLVCHQKVAGHQSDSSYSRKYIFVANAIKRHKSKQGQSLI